MNVAASREHRSRAFFDAPTGFARAAEFVKLWRALEPSSQPPSVTKAIGLCERTSPLELYDGLIRAAESGRLATLDSDGFDRFLCAKRYVRWRINEEETECLRPRLSEAADRVRVLLVDLDQVEDVAATIVAAWSERDPSDAPTPAEAQAWALVYTRREIIDALDAVTRQGLTGQKPHFARLLELQRKAMFVGMQDDAKGAT